MILTREWKVGVYCRLSKEDELDDESKSIKNQREYCTKYVLDNGYQLINTYVDDGVSGTLENRSGFNQMLRDIDDKKINMVVVKDTSRLARTSEMCTKYAFEVFPQKMIRFVIPGFYDSLTKENNDGIYMKAFFDEWFVRDTSNKIRKTFNTKRELGEFIGGTPPYGYNKDSNNKNKLVIDEYSSCIVKRIFDMFAKGIGVKMICYTLTDEGVPIPSEYKKLNRGQKSSTYGKWVPRTVRDMLSNETYIGNLTQGRGKKVSYKSKKKIRTSKDKWYVVKNSCPRIIDLETWNIVQDIYKANRNRQLKTHDLLLRGFLYCKECNHTIGISLSKWTKKDETKHQAYYCYCNYYKKMSRYNVCTPHKVNYEKLESSVLNEIRKICNKYVETSNLETILKNSDKTNKKIRQLEQRAKDIQKELDVFSKRTNDIYMDKVHNKITDEIWVNAYNSLVKENGNNKIELKEIENKLLELKKKNVNVNDTYKKVTHEFLSMKKPSKQFLASIIDKIYIDNDLNIEIIYKIKSLY